jgi:MYXO-CTERM domain-containing protein
LAAPVDITSGANVIATVDNLSTMLICDPLVNLGFVVTAGGANAHVTIKSALLSFAAINNAHGTASAQIGITDNDGNGATLTGGGAGGMGYLAQYNGYVPGGTTFASLVPSFSVGTFGSDNRNGNVPDTPIVPPVSNMSSQFDFTITANDSASGTSVYVITPEPGSLALLVLGGLALIRRRG